MTETPLPNGTHDFDPITAYCKRCGCSIEERAQTNADCKGQEGVASLYYYQRRRKFRAICAKFGLESL